MDTATQVAKKDENGQVVISKLNEQLLQQVAAATNGTYVHMDNSDDAVAQVIAQYAQIEKKALGDTSLFTYTTFYSWLAIPMLALLLAELFISDRKRIRS
jgi:Ca-activated chloride channel family protein